MDDPAWFERIGPADAQQLATEVGPVPANVGALLLLDPGVDPAHLAEVLAVRMAGIPRMRQRLREAPFGGGRPVWVDDPRFDARRHVHLLACPGADERAALLAAAVAEVTRPLDRDRPLWRASVLSGARDGCLGVVVVLHHVLADGMGGLALLAGLVDAAPAGNPTRPAPVTLRPAPTPRILRADAARARFRALRAAPRAAASLGPALTELGRDRPAAAPRTSLNAPTGPRRAAGLVSVDLASLHQHAHDQGATVNDVLLVAVARAMAALLEVRGEHVSELVISVPVSARRGDPQGRLGNQVGVMPVRVPLDGSRGVALRQVAAMTAARRTAQRGASTALITPAFRLLAALRLFRPMIERQRLVNSFLTNMRGPDQPIALAGAAVREIAPLIMATGNIGIAFAALSYAGTLTVTVLADPDVVPELDLLAVTLRTELDSV